MSFVVSQPFWILRSLNPLVELIEHTFLVAIFLPIFIPKFSVTSLLKIVKLIVEPQNFNNLFQTTVELEDLQLKSFSISRSKICGTFTKSTSRLINLRNHFNQIGVDRLRREIRKDFPFTSGFGWWRNFWRHDILNITLSGQESSTKIDGLSPNQSLSSTCHLLLQ